MKKNNFNSSITKALEVYAQDHPAKQQLSQNVLAQLQQRRQHAPHYLGAGFALAAAIMGVAVLPSIMSDTPDTASQYTTTVQPTKISPQLAEDLEMLLVLGENNRHG